MQWAVMAAPLIAGNNLANMSNETVAILTHPGILRINQDPLGIQGIRIQTFGQQTNFSDVYGDPLVRWEHEVFQAFGCGSSCAQMWT